MQKSRHSQLSLPVQLADNALFDTFHPAGNEAVVAAVMSAVTGAGPSVMWLFGKPASGKSHLLQAACALAGERGLSAAYLPLQERTDLAPAALEGWETRGLVCLDDIDRVVGKKDWELQLFSLYNRLHEHGGRLIVTADTAPGTSRVELADLRSRLASGPVYRVHALNDSECRAALSLRASRRGLTLPDKTARYLQNHYRRDMASLYALLDTLDAASLAAQRRLTIPFVKSILAPEAPPGPGAEKQ